MSWSSLDRSLHPFIQVETGDGSLHSVDATLALQAARDVYTRRQEGVSIWVVRSQDIHATQAEDEQEFFEPAADKIYRHPTFYEVPEDLKL